MQVGSNVCTNVVIDAGASATVCSLGFMKYIDPKVRDNRKAGRAKCRFWDIRRLRILGSILITGHLNLNTSAGIARRTRGSQRDVVDTIIPVLISRLSLARMNAVIHFDKNFLMI